MIEFYIDKIVEETISVPFWETLKSHGDRGIKTICEIQNLDFDATLPALNDLRDEFLKAKRDLARLKESNPTMSARYDAQFVGVMHELNTKARKILKIKG